MNTVKLIAIVLMVVGLLGASYGGFSYTKNTTAIKLGPVELAVKERETINVPLWLGVASILVGGALLVFPAKK